MSTHINKVIPPKFFRGKFFGEKQQDWRYRHHELRRESKVEKKFFAVVRTELLEKCRIVSFETMSAENIRQTKQRNMPKKDFTPSLKSATRKKS